MGEGAPDGAPSPPWTTALAKDERIRKLVVPQSVNLKQIPRPAGGQDRIHLGWLVVAICGLCALLIWFNEFPLLPITRSERGGMTK